MRSWTLALLLCTACGLAGGRSDETAPVPVEVGEVRQEPIALKRTFHGSLEPSSRIEVATLIGGRVAALPVDIGDPVDKGQVVAVLDRGEYAMAVTEARSSVSVAQAARASAQVDRDQAVRELARVETLHAKGAVSDKELEDARALARATEADLARAQAAVAAARASMGGAQVRYEDTQVVATWSDDDPRRVVAERFVDEGSVVPANTTLLTLVDLDPLRAVIHATERDHVRLRPGQEVFLTTDAWPGEVFPASVARVAPVFDADSRQARVELAVPNTDERLKPGLFVRAEVVLESKEGVTTVPTDALTRRDDRTVVFVLNPDDTVDQVAIVPGIVDGDRVEVVEGNVSGQVVTLGQQLVGDGSRVFVPEGSGP